MPERIQMTRQHPWRAEHPDAVIVDRRTKWGNEWAVIAWGGRHQVRHTTDWEIRSVHDTHLEAVRAAVEYFRESMRGVDVSELHGRDLACWCPLDQPCHADVLLELANQEES